MRITPPMGNVSFRTGMGKNQMGSETNAEYHFFVFDWSHERPQPKPLPDNLAIRVFSPSLHSLRVSDFTNIWLYRFWYLFSVRKYKIYFILDQGRVVHLSHVISRNPKFPFLGPDDFEIGPCWTDPEYRGLGLYPNVLVRILADFEGHAGRLFIFAEKENEASLKGIVKSGFQFLGVGEKTGILGKYEITRWVADGPADAPGPAAG